MICGWKIDATNFRAVPFGADGRPLPELNLHPLFQAILNIAADEARGDIDDLERSLTKIARGW